MKATLVARMIIMYYILDVHNIFIDVKALGNMYKTTSISGLKWSYYALRFGMWIKNYILFELWWVIRAIKFIKTDIKFIKISDWWFLSEHIWGINEICDPIYTQLQDCIRSLKKKCSNLWPHSAYFRFAFSCNYSRLRVLANCRSGKWILRIWRAIPFSPN